ncbi:MAG TPA: sulfate ABC transporter ATP-binding protein [Alphaproteobacteria bacterium]|nr:sulfate ABC transporter ATP-binding protein [Alphaproteobacteria bacterium]
MSIEIRGIVKRFGGFDALKGIDLTVASGEFVALLGPSGSGKTTLLRIIAGLEQADGGTVLLSGADVGGTAVRERKVGFVFQHYALFRHMTVLDNVAFGLKVKPRAERPSKGEIRDRAMRLLELVQLGWLADRYPSQLSGGQRQRVALARALAIEPQVLLLDEPFGALDAKVRKELRGWLRGLHDEMRLTSVFVTHDQEEALELADRVVVMRQGAVEQVGTPQQVYDHPASPYVFDFLGTANRLPFRREGGGVAVAGVAVPGLAAPSAEGLIYIRPHDIEVLPEPSADGLGGRVGRLFEAGPSLRADVLLEGGTRLDVDVARNSDAAALLRSRDQVWLRLSNPKFFAAG